MQGTISNLDRQILILKLKLTRQIGLLIKYNKLIIKEETEGSQIADRNKTEYIQTPEKEKKKGNLYEKNIMDGHQINYNSQRTTLHLQYRENTKDENEKLRKMEQIRSRLNVTMWNMLRERE